MKIQIKNFNHHGMCSKCRNSQIIEGNNIKQTIVLCHYYDRMVVPFEVKECNRYSSVLEKDEYELGKIAWILEVKKGKPVGFISPDEVKKKNSD